MINGSLTLGSDKGQGTQMNKDGRPTIVGSAPRFHVIPLAGSWVRMRINLTAWPFIGPIVAAPPLKRSRGLIDVAMTLFAATLPIWVGVVVAPAFHTVGGHAVDPWGAIKHGELFVAATVLLAPILSMTVRRDWVPEVRTGAISFATYVVIPLSTGFFFALLAFPEIYADPYAIGWSIGTFLFAALVLATYAVQTIQAPSVASPTVLQEREKNQLRDELVALRREED